jgi:two-component system OmpR family response regulator
MKQHSILVIDNDESVLDVISTVLTEANYSVIPALKPPVASVASINPDLVIIDISLNCSCHEDFYRQLKTEVKTARISVLLTSTSSALEKTAEKWKADSFFYKPFDIEELTAKVNGMFMKSNRTD